jgi:2-dehydropantoate 2-reductase
MNVYIVGAGAVGTYIGELFAGQGATVTYAPRELEEVRQVRADLAIVAVKAYDTDAAIAALRKALGVSHSATILCVQNGVGNEEKIAAVFGADVVVACALTIPVERAADGVRIEANAGGIGLAPMGSLAHNWLTAALMGSGIPLSVVSDYRSLKWSKLSLNILANATCAILDVLPEVVVARTDLFALEMRVLAETQAVMHAMGVVVMNLPGYPVRALYGIASFPPLFARMLLGSRIAGARGSKPPSLLLDVRAGKAKTEVHVLNGGVAVAGREHGVPTPVNAALARVLDEIVREPQRREKYRERPDVLCAHVALEEDRL